MPEPGNPELHPTFTSPEEVQDVYETPSELTGITFELKSAQGKEVWVSNDPTHRLKFIELSSSSLFTPEPGVGYDVRVIADTNNESPSKGKLIVEILSEEDVPLAEVPKHKDGPPPIEVDEVNKKVYVLESSIDYNPQGGKLVPNAEKFSHFTLSAVTLETLEKVARAAQMRAPCLLEGATATSKTSSIEYLAMKSNNELARINLNGQTDTSELIGKFVPNDGELTIEFENIIRHPEQISNESRHILMTALEEGRGLTLIESQKIAQNEGLKIPDWRWQDGILVDAMKHGRWVILDEINLAEPQILERLNSLLERDPMLVLSEYDGTKIGKNGDIEVHPNFRIFGTMNPAEYAGRAPMSPAFKDRWSMYKYVDAPGEKDYEQMIECMVYGRQPDIELRGMTYKGEKVESLYEKLGQIEGMGSFIPKLAKFHASIETMARESQIGRNKKEGYVFSRRTLLNCLDLMEDIEVVNRREGTTETILDNPEKIIRRAIEESYLDKIADDGKNSDREKVVDLLEAGEIGGGKFNHEFRVDASMLKRRQSRPRVSSPS